MNPLSKVLYQEYPRHDEPVRADKAIIKLLKQVQKEEGICLLHAFEKLLRATVKFSIHRGHMIATGQSEKTFTPMCASWFNGGGPLGDSSNWPMPPAAARELTAEWAKANWEPIYDAYSICWEDARYFDDNWQATLQNLPAAVRADLKAAFSESH